MEMFGSSRETLQASKYGCKQCIIYNIKIIVFLSYQEKIHLINLSGLMDIRDVLWWEKLIVNTTLLISNKTPQGTFDGVLWLLDNGRRPLDKTWQSTLHKSKLCRYAVTVRSEQRHSGTLLKSMPLLKSEWVIIYMVYYHCFMGAQ